MMPGGCFEPGFLARAQSSQRGESLSNRLQGVSPAVSVSVGQCAEVGEGLRLARGEEREGGAGRRERGGGRGRGGASAGRAQLDRREPDRKGGQAGGVRRGGRWQVGRKGMVGSLKRRRRRMRGEREEGMAS